jgi:hypothetical protein
VGLVEVERDPASLVLGEGLLRLDGSVDEPQEDLEEQHQID